MYVAIDTIVAEQGIIKAQYEYNTAVVNATTQVINCENTANITGKCANVILNRRLIKRVRNWLSTLIADPNFS
jgi:hypothetical protein